MAHPTHEDAERALRRLLADNDLPAPDAIECRPGELVALYESRKVAIVIELRPERPAAAEGTDS